MQGPTWEKTAQRHVGRPTGKPKRLTRGALSHFPDKSVVVKMEQRGRRNRAGEDAFNRVYSKMRIEITERAIGKYQPHIKPDERAAPSKHEAHESTNITVFFHAIAIVDPDKREVLHVVEDFEQRDADEN